VKLAANYSAAAAALVQSGQVALDYFKCPAWPDLILRAQAILPAYVHFPLQVGWGRGDALDGETGGLPDWDKIERLLTQTGTPYVNLHLTPRTLDWPAIPVDTADPAHVELITQALVRDVQAVCRRLGPERVAVENDHHNARQHLRPGFLPSVITRVVGETGCGLLLDLGHARISASELGLANRDYTAALPVSRLREIHIAGVQRLEGEWLERIEAIAPDFAHRYAHHLGDHLPMTGDDWALLDWAAGQIRSGAWAEPWIMTLEFGGVGPLWELLGTPAELCREITRLHQATAHATQRFTS
jgi:uncharacterized protein